MGKTVCTNPTHLILFAKKQSIAGETFANANKYHRARKNDPNAMSMEDLMNEDVVDSDDGSGHSGPLQIEESEIKESPITITQSITNKNEDDKKEQQQTLQTTEESKKRTKEKKGKKKKKLLIAAEMLGKLKKTTNYTRFETPLYILPLNIAEKKKEKDGKRIIRNMGLQIGYKVQLKQKNMKGVVKFIGEVHFTFGVIVGLEMDGNGKGKHSGDIDKIKYFDCKRNGGLFVRADSIEKIIEKKRLKTKQKNKSLDKTTGERFNAMLQSMDNEDYEENDDSELDLSELSKKERFRLERLHLEIGDVVEVDKGRKGILHFYGHVHWTDDVIFGVEFMDKAVGKYNGTYGDVTYFKCPEKRGMFFTSDKIRKKGILNALSEW